jgi:four helix bundle protein
VATISTFEELEAWQRARELVRVIYNCSGAGGFAKDFALRDQIRRAVVSVLPNIAEGFERSGDREFVQFLATAKGSCGEVRAQLYAALDQGYVTDEQFATASAVAIEVSKLIAGLMRYPQQSALKGEQVQIIDLGRWTLDVRLSNAPVAQLD